MVNAMSQPIYCWEREMVPILQEAERAQGPHWIGVEKKTFLSPRVFQTELSVWQQVAVPTALSRPLKRECSQGKQVKI